MRLARPSVPFLGVALVGFLGLGCGDSSGDGGEGGAGGAPAAGGMGSGGAPTATGGSPSGSGGALEEPEPCAPRAGELVPELVSISITNASGAAPAKGDRLRVSVELRNGGSGVGPVSVTPRIDSQRFSDYSSVPVGTAEATLCQGTTTIEIEGGPFFDRPDLGKHYALGSGAYTLSSLEVTTGAEPVVFESIEGGAFEVASSNVLLVPVIYDEAYFQQIQGLTTESPEAYLTQAFTRPHQLFTPTTSDPDGPGNFQTFPGGFDEMMGVRHLFRAFSDFPGETTTTQGWCEDATFYAQNTLGMAADWVTRPQATQAERHGFDYLLALHSGLGGGVACGWIDVQVSGFINRDIDRQQIIVVHETAHLFGAPHCNDVGNGSGGDLLGYVMCSGERHANYPEYFVFHSTSRERMSSKWN